MYASRDFRPLWLGPDDRPNAAAREALSVLAGASIHGMDPAAYDAQGLSELFDHLNERGSAPIESGIARFEVGMSTAVLTYFRHLHVGRVEPALVRFEIPSRAHEHDYGALLQSAAESARVRAAADDLAPAFRQYRALQDALARYRLLASRPEGSALPQVKLGVRPGDSYAGAHALSRRLVAIGELSPEHAESSSATLYSKALSEGVERFQRRHALTADGVLGKATLAALNVPVTWRVRQIELAMERLRWLPHAQAQPFIAVNIPFFRLIARDAESSLDMAVIVGRAVKTETPVFIDEMTHLIFRPYWNVPPSIVRNEILPALARDPLYLQRHDMEIVSGPGDDARAVAPVAENIALLRRGALRVRQRPGAANSLGLVKFMFPNDANVYMHDTPARQLFARSKRDFSHGCIRLEDPTALAQWVLRPQGVWTRDRIVAAMQGSETVRVNLSRPVKVVLYYVTAMVDGNDGNVHFSQDIYGHDAKLDRMLAIGRAEQRPRHQARTRPVSTWTKFEPA